MVLSLTLNQAAVQGQTLQIGGSIPFLEEDTIVLLRLYVISLSVQHILVRCVCIYGMCNKL